jgi:cytochrome c oxidase cbb3-type subunit 3
MNQRLYITSVVATSVLTVLAACSSKGRSEDRTVAASAAPPPAQSPVGPIPGPMKDVAERTNPYANDPKALAQGRLLFVSFNCSGCHGGRAGGGMGPSLRDQDWIYGGKSRDIFDSIAQGRANGMPAWGTMLPEQTIWQLTAYIQSLRTPSEPSPPG